jgi:hypothetical protein
MKRWTHWKKIWNLAKTKSPSLFFSLAPARSRPARSSLSRFARAPPNIILCAAPLLATPSVLARRRSSVSSQSAHFLAAAASPGPQSRISPNPPIIVHRPPAALMPLGGVFVGVFSGSSGSREATNTAVRAALPRSASEAAHHVVRPQSPPRTTSFSRTCSSTSSQKFDRRKASSRGRRKAINAAGRGASTTCRSSPPIPTAAVQHQGQFFFRLTGSAPQLHFLYWKWNT